MCASRSLPSGVYFLIRCGASLGYQDNRCIVFTQCRGSHLSAFVCFLIRSNFAPWFLARSASQLKSTPRVLHLKALLAFHDIKYWEINVNRLQIHKVKTERDLTEINNHLVMTTNTALRLIWSGAFLLKHLQVNMFKNKLRHTNLFYSILAFFWYDTLLAYIITCPSWICSCGLCFLLRV